MYTSIGLQIILNVAGKVFLSCALIFFGFHHKYSANN